jgi:hypothetical protein
MPITYLGIPLTIHKPTSAQMQQMVDRVTARLPSWKANLMDKAGRLTMVKSVLGAIPIHQLLVLAPSKKTLRLIVKIERSFLWAGRAAANGGHCHVNWQRVAHPIALGGLGVHDLERTSMALRLRWMWFSQTDDRRAWHGLELQFTDQERALFFVSTTMILGNGHTAKFWDDRWLDGRSVKEIAPSLHACTPKRRRKSRTVADGLQDNRWARDIHGTLGIQEIGEYLQLWQRVEGTLLSQDPDHLCWKWTASGIYSAKSAYLATFQGAIACPAAKHIWRTWAPQKVKFFLWLALQDRCWTAERLARRGLPHHPRCLLCDQLPETMHHLLIDCPFVKQVWHEALAWLRMPCRTPDSDSASLTDWITETKPALPKPLRRGFASATLLIPWMLWKHRNDCVFNRARPSTQALLVKIKEEATDWARAGALGLRAVLPTSWDVH